MFHKNSPSLSSFRSRPRRILRLSRSPINPFSSSSFYPSINFCSLGRVTCKTSRLLCLLRRSLFISRFCLGLLRKKPHRFRLCLVSLFRIFVLFIDLAISSFLSCTILVSNLVPLLSFPSSPQSSSPCNRLDILNVFFTISSVHSNPSPSSLPPFSPHLRRQFSTFITSPSPMYPRTPLPSTLILLGSLSVPPLFLFTSLSFPMSLRRPHRRMRDRPRHFRYFKFVFVFSPSRRFGRLLSAIVQHVRRIRVDNAILLCSFSGSRSRRVCSHLHLHLSSFTFSPTSASPTS